jgi:tRNA threonylcarbamoyladenosine biosynthesis protein TsaE
MKIYQSSSSEDTQKIAKEIAINIKKNLNKRAKNAVIFELIGNLGSGKTTFVKGFIKEFGFRGNIKSPTFIIMRRTKVKNDFFDNVFHIDAYRLKKIDDFLALNFKEIISNPKNIVLIEWPQNIKNIIKEKTIKIKFFYGKKENERIIKI